MTASLLSRVLSPSLLLLLYLCPCIPGEKILGVENEDFDFDGLPGANHEFKISVGAGKEECMYQKIVAGGKLHVSFEVLRGGDHTIDVFVKSDVNDVLQSAIMKSNWVFETDVSVTGDFAICLDNTFSRLASKLVYIYIVTYVEEEWNSFVKELEEVQLTVANFSNSVNEVKLSLSEALKHQAHSRMNVVRDFYQILANNSYVKVWSIAQVIVIIASACFQVFFVRRLFKTTHVTKTSKPRA